jgi:hypothetical protein
VRITRPAAVMAAAMLGLGSAGAIGACGEDREGGVTVEGGSTSTTATSTTATTATTPAETTP